MNMDELELLDFNLGENMFDFGVKILVGWGKRWYNCSQVKGVV